MQYTVSMTQITLMPLLSNLPRLFFSYQQKSAGIPKYMIYKLWQSYIDQVEISFVSISTRILVSSTA